MKTPTNVTLIVMGALLILAPLIADVLYQHNLVTLLTHAPGANVPISVTTRLSGWTKAAHWVAGSLMILLGILGALIALRWPYYTDADEEDLEEEDEDSIR